MGDGGTTGVARRRNGARATDRGAPLDLGSLDLGGCASSRLDHGLKFYGIRGGCASSRLIHGFLFAIFGRASGQIYSKNSKNIDKQLHFWDCNGVMLALAQGFKEAWAK